MTSLEWQTLWWNWKLNSSADLLYYEKINVDVVHPPYAKRDRNSSFFFKTRRGYVWDLELSSAFYNYSTDANNKKYFDITDIQIIWDSNCERENWTVFYMWVSRDKSRKSIMTRRIEDWCLQPQITPLNQKNLWWEFPQWCTCTDNKFFKTLYAKWEPRTTTVVPWTDDDMWIRGGDWIQINRSEGWAMRWYFSAQEIEDKQREFAWWRGSNPIQPWDYLVVYGSTNLEWDWFCWQVRTIVDYNKATGWLVLDSAWSWFKDWEEIVKWGNLSYQIFSQWGETLWFTSGKGIDIITSVDNSLTMCDFWRPTWDAECIIDSCVSTDRVFVLYNNWWIHFWWYGRDKFFDSWDAMYVGVDKTDVEIYRSYILAMGKRNISVWMADETWQYYHMYNQSSTIWIKNRWAYWEYNGDFLIVSNDNRLLALKFNAYNNWTGSYMLEFEDIWQYVNPYFKALLPWDECYIGVDNNALRIFINTVWNVEWDNKNSRTLILKYDTTFWVWTVDVLKYFIIRWVYEWIYFWDAVYWREGNKDWWVESSPSQEESMWKYEVKISAFLLENEENWMKTTEATADLFRLASLQKLIVLLWMGRYDNSNTKIKITEYRNWFWYEYQINSLDTNTWLDSVWAAYEWQSIQVSDCVLSDISDNSNVLRTTCEEWHKIQEPISQEIWCEYEHPFQLTDHSVCINDNVYKLAPTMPLTIELWDQEKFNTEIYVELISDNDDVINFGWFMAQLSMAPLWYKWADWEYMIEVESGC